MNPCNICGWSVSTKKPRWSRLRRPDGGFDHTTCALGIDTYELQKLRQEGKEPRATPPVEEGRARTWVHRKKLEDDSWIISCGLCGKRFNRIFRQNKRDDPGRAASEYIGEHLESPEHAAATEAYRAPPTKEALSPEEEMLQKIFGELDDTRTLEQMRRRAAKNAAELTHRSGRSPSH